MNRRCSILALMLWAALSMAANTAAGAAVAQVQPSEEGRRAQVKTATANAVDRLREEIGAARITGAVTVDQFLRQTDSSGEFKQALQRAQQIGGPRWTDEQVCQVQLEISGEQVAEALVDIAASSPQRSPLRPEELARELKGWKNRSFSATGTSGSPQRVDVIRPRRVDDWERVSDDVRTRAIRTAQQDAARRALESVRAVQLAPGLTVADALAKPQVAQRMNAWFESRPIKSVAFKENLQVDLTLGAPADETFDELIATLETTGGLKLPPEAEQPLERARVEFVRRMAEPVGRANVTRDAVRFEPETVELPPQAPDWINRQIDAEGTAPASRERRLASVQAAQERAVQNLRAKIGSLPLSDGLTVDEAARKDVAIARALDRAMVRARVFKVDYGADGSTTVRMMIDPRDVWDEISAHR